MFFILNLREFDLTDFNGQLFFVRKKAMEKPYLNGSHSSSEDGKRKSIFSRNHRVSTSSNDADESNADTER